MSSTSSIEWTDATWNPVTGCDRVSPGCKHCYALDLAARLKAMGQKRYQRDGQPPTSGPGFGVTLHEDKLDEPLRWQKPRMVFVNSMSDLFHPEVPDGFILRAWSVMRRAERHTFQVLTKRPERMRDFVRRLAWISPSEPYLYEAGEDAHTEAFGPPYVCPNIWLGTSIELRTYVDRADHLRATPAAVRFISAEPLLGPLAPEWVGVDELAPCDSCDEPEAPYEVAGLILCRRCAFRRALDLTRIDWLIVGGESGPNARPMQIQWARALRDACIEQGADRTAFFFKQWGGRTPKAGGRELDGRTWDELPEREAVAA